MSTVLGVASFEWVSSTGVVHIHVRHMGVAVWRLLGVETAIEGIFSRVVHLVELREIIKSERSQQYVESDQTTCSQSQLKN